MNDTQGPEEGRVAVVTGAAGGIGQAAAVALAEVGYRLVLADLTAESMLETERQVLALETKAHVVGMDVSSEADWADLVRATLASFGRLDVLVNNAGIEGPITSIETYPADDFRRVMEVNTVGPFLGVKHCAAPMRDVGGGVVVNIASSSGLRGSRNIAAYVASKHALLGFTKSAALELAADGTRVCAVCPTPVDTEMIGRLATHLRPDDPAEARAGLDVDNPLGRISRPEEIARVVRFLVGPDASYLTGCAVPVDGGALAR
jgi:NAD(P)-dependent dehydrogenase (short-subunit alcohol dehydrogenase family)